MAGRTHTYTLVVDWTGNRGTGTSTYASYDRTHTISADGKPVIAGSADPAFRGDKACYNPEDMLVASISTCHMLWYLHLASAAGFVVTAYRDAPVGTMVEDTDRGGWFTGVVLHPTVTIAAASNAAAAEAAHERAHKMCFVANSLNFPVTCEPTIIKA